MFDMNQWLVINCSDCLPVLGSRLGDADEDNFLIRMIDEYRLDHSTPLFAQPRLLGRPSHEMVATVAQLTPAP